MAAKCNIRPLGDKVIVQRVEAEAITPGGIVLPDSSKEKPKRGTVLAVGTGRLMDNGNRSSMEIKKNDEVYFAGYSGTEIKVDGQELLILAENDILCVVNQ